MFHQLSQVRLLINIQGFKKYDYCSHITFQVYQKHKPVLVFNQYFKMILFNAKNKNLKFNVDVSINHL